MSVEDSQGLLQSVLGFFVRRRPERSAQPTSLESRKRAAWLRTEAFLQQEAAAFDEPDPERIARTLRAFEDYVQYSSDGESDSVGAPDGRQPPDCRLLSTNTRLREQGFRRDMPYPKLRAMRSMMEHGTHDPSSYPGTTIRVSKRKRDSDAVIEELSSMEREARKRRVLAREEPNAADNLEEPDADFAVLMRRHLVSLDNALRKHWICVCQKCSGLSVRLSLPQQRKDFNAETSFEVFFGVRSPIETALQEAKITIK